MRHEPIYNNDDLISKVSSIEIFESIVVFKISSSYQVGLNN
jgi:hypothetical protein